MGSCWSGFGGLWVQAGKKGRAPGGPPGGSWATFGVSFLVLRCLVRRSAASRALLEAILSVQHPSQAISHDFVAPRGHFGRFLVDSGGCPTLKNQAPVYTGTPFSLFPSFPSGMRFRMLLDCSWEGLGRLFGSNSELLGRLGASLGRFWAALGRLGAVLGGLGVVFGSFGGF